MDNEYTNDIHMTEERLKTLKTSYLNMIQKLLQAITDTVVRSLISVVWELGARIFTTFMLFGVFNSVSQKNNKM